MALADFQTALGMLLTGPGRNDHGSDAKPVLSRKLNLSSGERAGLKRLSDSSGFRFTAAVQHSWCEGRATNAAALTLSILSPSAGRQMIGEWVRLGGGLSSFFASESDAFLDFIAAHLPDPSHELTVARLEQAVLRAGDAALVFRPPDAGVLSDLDRELRRSEDAALVRFFAEPHRIFTALDRHHPLPPLSDRAYPVLFAPGLSGLFREASKDEAALWERLAVPMSLVELSEEPSAWRIVQTLLAVGAVRLVRKL